MFVKSGGPQAEQLSDAILHFSNPHKEKIVEAAKKLARAAGLREADVAKISDDAVQRYEWKTQRGKMENSYILDMRFTQVKNNWELYFALGLEMQ